MFFNRTMVYKKKHTEKNSFCVCRLCKNYWNKCCTHMTSHAIWVDEVTGTIISTKKINKKLKHFEKIIFLNIFYSFSFLFTMCIYISIEFWPEYSFNYKRLHHDKNWQSGWHKYNRCDIKDKVVINLYKKNAHCNSIIMKYWEYLTSL